jgi:hypothetical protein
VCLAWILYGHLGVILPYVTGIATGILSGAAMLFCRVSLEANHPSWAVPRQERSVFRCFYSARYSPWLSDA